MVGRDKLTLRDLRRDYAELAPAERHSLGTRAARLAFVDATVDRKLLDDYGHELARRDPDALEGVHRQRSDVLVRRLRTLAGGERSVDSTDVDRAAVRIAEEHLLETARFATREAAEEARAKVEAGAPLDEAAREVNGLPGGAPQWVRWSPFPGAVIDTAAELPVGRISEPLADGTTWVLERVLQRRSTPAPEDWNHDAIARGVRARQVAGRVDALTRKLREDADIRYSDETIALLARRTEEAILDGEAGSLDADWAIPRLSDDERDLTVAEWKGGGRWTAGGYVDEIARWIPLQRPQLYLEAGVRAACEQVVDGRILLAEAERRGLESEWWTHRSLERLEEARYVQVALDQINSGAPDLAEADSVAALLHSSQPELFHRAPRARVFRIELPTEEAARAERNRIREAGGVRARFREILESKAVAAGTYRVLSVARGDMNAPATEAKLFDEPVGTLVGPVEQSGVWVLLETLARFPERELTADEVLVEVRQRMRRGNDKATIDAWLAARRKQVGVTVDEQTLDRLAPGV